MKFIDSIEIRIASGKGGRGLVSFRAAHNQPRLGPDGGDGGNGGGVYLLGDRNLNTLSKLYFKKLYAAEHGEKGGTNGKTGKTGEDLLIPVPLGTIAFSVETGEKICEVMEHQEKVLVAPGGKKGLGNLRFLSSIHQAPEEFTPGGPSIEFDLQLELKLIADVGFAGLPNAGKSTLLSRISAAKPKIADYPFTTLVPNLGVVDIAGEGQEFAGQSFVAADIPGLIAGASEGRGLGHEFLRHIERTQVIAFVLAAYDEQGEADVLATYRILDRELNNYSKELAAKPRIAVITKADVATNDEHLNKEKAGMEKVVDAVYIVSSVSGRGIDDFKRATYRMVAGLKQKIDATIEKDDDEELYAGYDFLVRANDKDILGY